MAAKAGLCGHLGWVVAWWRRERLQADEQVVVNVEGKTRPWEGRDSVVVCVMTEKSED